MPKIVIISNWIFSGGAEKQSLILAKTLNEHFKVFYCIYYEGENEERTMDEIKTNNIQLLLLSGNHFNKILQFYKFCKKEKINIIISYLFVGNLLNAIVGNILKIKHRIGGIRSSKHSKLKNIIQKIVHNYFLTLSISNSYSGKLECSKYGYKPQKIKVIPNCFEFKNESFSKKSDLLIKIITVARFVEAKDFLTSIQVIKNLISKTKNIQYTIVGFGELEAKIREWIYEYQLADYINIIISPKNVNEYLAKSDIYLSTSLYEGLSNSIMEAMSFSLPIVATNVGDNKYLVKDGENGYLCKVTDYESMADSIFYISSDKDRYMRFSSNSYQVIQKEFSNQKFADEYIKLINTFKPY
jgi:glycosyltransferase involved in cell wall biosynthesis